MVRILGILLLASALAFPAAARATEGMEEEGPESARAAAIQALAFLLGHPPPHDEAIHRLEEGLESGNTEGVDVGALRQALEALEADDSERATEILLTAFPEEDEHVVGVTFRPTIETARTVTGIVGGVVVALAILGLLQRRRADRRHGVV